MSTLAALIDAASLAHPTPADGKEAHPKSPELVALFAFGASGEDLSEAPALIEQKGPQGIVAAEILVASLLGPEKPSAGPILLVLGHLLHRKEDSFDESVKRKCRGICRIRESRLAFRG